LSSDTSLFQLLVPWFDVGFGWLLIMGVVGMHKMDGKSDGFCFFSIPVGDFRRIGLAVAFFSDDHFEFGMSMALHEDGGKTLHLLLLRRLFDEDSGFDLGLICLLDKDTKL